MKLSSISEYCWVAATQKRGKFYKKITFLLLHISSATTMETFCSYIMKKMWISGGHGDNFLIV